MSQVINQILLFNVTLRKFYEQILFSLNNDSNKCKILMYFSKVNTCFCLSCKCILKYLGLLFSSIIVVATIELIIFCNIFLDVFYLKLFVSDSNKRDLLIIFFGGLFYFGILFGVVINLSRMDSLTDDLLKKIYKCKFNLRFEEGCKLEFLIQELNMHRMVFNCFNIVKIDASLVPKVNSIKYTLYTF